MAVIHPRQKIHSTLALAIIWIFPGHWAIKARVHFGWVPRHCHIGFWDSVPASKQDHYSRHRPVESTSQLPIPAGTSNPGGSIYVTLWFTRPKWVKKMKVFCFYLDHNERLAVGLRTPGEYIDLDIMAVCQDKWWWNDRINTLQLTSCSTSLIVLGSYAVLCTQNHWFRYKSTHWNTNIHLNIFSFFVAVLFNIQQFKLFVM